MRSVTTKATRAPRMEPICTIEVMLDRSSAISCFDLVWSSRPNFLLKGSSSAVVPMRPSSIPRAAPMRPNTAKLSVEVICWSDSEWLTEHAIPKAPVQGLLRSVLQVLLPRVLQLERHDGQTFQGFV